MPDATARLDALIAMSRALGDPRADCIILGAGNTSAGADDEPFWFPYGGKYPDILKAFHLLLQGKLVSLLGPLKRLKKINREAE